METPITSVSVDSTPDEASLLWMPSPDRIASANLTRFLNGAEAASGLKLRDYEALWHWSIDRAADFWRLLWTSLGVIGDGPGAVVLENPDQMPGARFFPHARLNFAENLLRRNDDSDALVFWGEDKVRRRISWTDLNASVSQLQQALKAEGIKPGDRVAGILPNMPEAVVAMLASASLGAVWSSCSPDFGVQGVLDRFGQIEPKVLFAVDGYYYNGKTHDVLGKLAEIVPQLPSLLRVIVIPYVADTVALGNVANSVAFPGYVAGHSSADSSTRACHSIIPSTSCFPPGRPGRRNVLSTASAAHCCNT